MNCFKIGEFDFGIDVEKSVLEVGDGHASIEIWGTPESVDRAWDDEDGPWSFVLYPPQFYFRDVPCTINGRGEFRRKLDWGTDTQHEIGLYLLEHFSPEPCEVSLQESQVRVLGHLPRGLVEHELTFEIIWDLEAEGTIRPVP